MKAIVLATSAVLAAMALGGAATSAQAGKCVLAGGEATMITEDLAKFMAGAALKNSMAAHSWKPQGAVKMTCDSASGLPHCVARQKACG
jgi:hypothetical protein